MKTRTMMVCAACLLMVLVAAACAKQGAAAPGQAPGQAPAVVVKIDNFSFGPMDLEVKAGTTVTWVNHDDIPHTVVSTEGVFKSKVLDTDEQFSYTFQKPGKYPYFCSVHPKMTASVTVH